MFEKNNAEKRSVNGKSWVLVENRIAFLESPVLEHYYNRPAHQWQAYPYNPDFAAEDEINHDIILAKRIRSKVKQPEIPGEIIDLLREIERDISAMQEISK